MKRFRIGTSVMLGLLTGAATQAEVVIETVTVGNPGNAGEWSGDSHGGYGPDAIVGGVDYVYEIGKYEVTAAQYTEFLNAVADEDTYRLYSEYMGLDLSPDNRGCNIQRTGSSGSYYYAVAPDWGDRPVNYVGWGDAARFANWLHNGQPTGVQDLSTTEDGSYFLNGATSNEPLLPVVREPNATWVIPSEDEWYKAAYHKNDGATGNYYNYPTSSDSVPGYVNDSGNLTGTGTPFTEGATDPGNYATYGAFVTHGIGVPYYRTEVGEWENSESPHGTFDQGGNVSEWNQAVIDGSFRGNRGGAFGHFGTALHAAYRYRKNPGPGGGKGGSRVARVPAAVCADGITHWWAEECDDGNTVDGDGCSSSCTVEIHPPLPADPPYDFRKNRYIAFNSNNTDPIVIQVQVAGLVCSLSGDACSYDEDCPDFGSGERCFTPNGFDPVSSQADPEWETIGWLGEPCTITPGTQVPDDTWHTIVVSGMPALPGFEYTDPATSDPLSTVFVADCEIMPRFSYGLRTNVNGITFTERLVIGTIREPVKNAKKWADVVGARDPGTGEYTEPDERINVDDVSVMIVFMNNKAYRPHVTVVDLSHEVVNYKINADDLQMVIRAFNITEDYPPLKFQIEASGAVHPRECPFDAATAVHDKCE